MKKKSDLRVSALHFRVYRAGDIDYTSISSSLFTPNKRRAMALIMKKADWKFVDWPYQSYYQPFRFSASCDLVEVADIVRTVRIDRKDLKYIAGHSLKDVEKWLYAKKVVE